MNALCHAIGAEPFCLDSYIAEGIPHPRGPFRRRRGCHGLATGARGRCGRCGCARAAATKVHQSGKGGQAEAPPPSLVERTRSSRYGRHEIVLMGLVISQLAINDSCLLRCTHFCSQLGYPGRGAMLRLLAAPALPSVSLLACRRSGAATARCARPRAGGKSCAYRVAREAKEKVQSSRVQ